jgi:hypothetical protein
MKKSHKKGPDCAGETHRASWTPVRQPPIVVPPAAEGRGKKRAPAAPRVARRPPPQLTKLPRHRGPIFVVPCKICGNKTSIARSDVIPICEDCMLNVVPKSVAQFSGPSLTLGAMLLGGNRRPADLSGGHPFPLNGP